LRVGYYWPTLFRNAHSYDQRCKVYPTSVGRENKSDILLYLRQLINHFSNGIYTL
jgi:hypothetical protein